MISRRICMWRMESTLKWEWSRNLAIPMPYQNSGSEILWIFLQSLKWKPERTGLRVGTCWVHNQPWCMDPGVQQAVFPGEAVIHVHFSLEAYFYVCMHHPFQMFHDPKQLFFPFSFNFQKFPSTEPPFPHLFHASLWIMHLIFWSYVW